MCPGCMFGFEQEREGRAFFFFSFVLFCLLVDVADALDREGRDKQQTQLACRGKQPPPPYKCLSFTPVFLSRRLSILFFFFFAPPLIHSFSPFFFLLPLSSRHVFSTSLPWFVPPPLSLFLFLSLSLPLSLPPFLVSSPPLLRCPPHSDLCFLLSLSISVWASLFGYSIGFCCMRGS